MNGNKSSRLAWMLCGIICVGVLFSAATVLAARPANDNAVKFAGNVVWALDGIVFALLATLILSRRPRNVIGWLLMAPALAFAVPTQSYLDGLAAARTAEAAPAAPGLPLLLAAWFNTWAWTLLIYPLLLIILLFPTGRTPSSRWRWLIGLALAMFTFFLFVATFIQRFEVAPGWSLVNPIGFIPGGGWMQYFGTVWGLGMLLLTVFCVVSLVVRYRRAAASEQEQIRWLLFACGLFVAVYVPLNWISESTTILNDIGNVSLGLAILTIPTSIAIAILRHRLFDIDVIIRRTLVYASLTATMALVYFGSVVLLQTLLRGLTGQVSPVAIVASTLVIAALFTPLRRRVQNLIDRRFYRRKYDAARTLEAFAAELRAETDLDQVQGRLVQAVTDSLQPSLVSVWLREPFATRGINYGHDQ